MWNFSRRRHTAGNICLVLFTALIFAIVVAPCIAAENAEAAFVPVANDHVTAYDNQQRAIGYDAQIDGYRLLINLAVSPATDFSSLRFDFINANGTVMSVYGDHMSKVYVNNSVYGAVYQLTYDVPSSFRVSTDGKVYGKVYVDGQYLFEVIMTLDPKPPQPGESGGSSGGSSIITPVKTTTFADIANHWARADIELLLAKGIVKGMSATSFAPDADITRAQFATMMVKALGLNEVAYTGRFTDVAANAWYAKTVETAVTNGLAIGYGNGQFKPNANITREEMAVMITNAVKVGGKDITLPAAEVEQLLTKFTDNQQISSWAQNSVAYAVKSSIITGRTTATFVPGDNATRAEGAVMIVKMMKLLGKL